MALIPCQILKYVGVHAADEVVRQVQVSEPGQAGEAAGEAVQEVGGQVKDGEGGCQGLETRGRHGDETT